MQPEKGNHKGKAELETVKAELDVVKAQLSDTTNSL